MSVESLTPTVLQWAQNTWGSEPNGSKFVEFLQSLSEQSSSSKTDFQTQLICKTVLRVYNAQKEKKMLDEEGTTPQQAFPQWPFRQQQTFHLAMKLWEKQHVTATSSTPSPLLGETLSATSRSGRGSKPKLHHSKPTSRPPGGDEPPSEANAGAGAGPGHGPLPPKIEPDTISRPPGGGEPAETAPVPKPRSKPAPVIVTMQDDDDDAVNITDPLPDIVRVSYFPFEGKPEKALSVVKPIIPFGSRWMQVHLDEPVDLPQVYTVDLPTNTTDSITTETVSGAWGNYDSCFIYQTIEEYQLFRREKTLPKRAFIGETDMPLYLRYCPVRKALGFAPEHGANLNATHPVKESRTFPVLWCRAKKFARNTIAFEVYKQPGVHKPFTMGAWKTTVWRSE